MVLAKAGAGSVSSHLRYIQRDGVTLARERGQAYDASSNSADIQTFERRSTRDRHQFRFIVSVEDAVDLQELRDYTRELMRRVEVDLATPLEWVAVDHWDTDNPHTHIVLRGRSAGGSGATKDLVISPDYMAHGMRVRASLLATEWLGPRTELEIDRTLQREVLAERWTSLDSQLERHAKEGVVELWGGKEPETLRRRALLLGRLQHLAEMDLAEQAPSGAWRLRPGFGVLLRRMGERGDVLRNMRRALGDRQRELVEFDARRDVPLVGRVIGSGMTDEMHERGYLVVDGIDGRAYSVKLPKGDSRGQFPEGSIVQAGGSSGAGRIDEAIGRHARDGIYRTDAHISTLQAQGKDLPSSQEAVSMHVRRLEALRRAGLVERIGDGAWRVPTDLATKGRVYDAQCGPAGRIVMLSHLPVDGQIRALGATWLDHQVLQASVSADSPGFGAEVWEASRKRVAFLYEQGLVKWQGSRAAPVPDLISRLRSSELAVESKRLGERTGMPCVVVENGGRAHGIYRNWVQLVSGRFAVLEHDGALSLVPWKPVIEHRIGQHLIATVRGTSATWEFGRRRELGL